MEKKEAEKTVKEFITLLKTDKGIEFEKEIEALETLTKKKSLNTLDRYILFSLGTIIVYTIAHTVIFAITGQEAKILDGLFFGCFGLEILFCFLIKRFKLHEEAKIVFGNKKKSEISDDFDGVE